MHRSRHMQVQKCAAIEGVTGNIGRDGRKMLLGWRFAVSLVSIMIMVTLGWFMPVKKSQTGKEKLGFAKAAVRQDRKIAVGKGDRNKTQGSRDGHGIPRAWPVPAGEFEITGWFNEVRETGRHRGIDIGVPVGTPVSAAFPGKFYKGYEGENNGFGRYVYLVHENGLTTYYAHLREWASIEEGSEVAAGDFIGWSGNTGYSTGPHLHFEVRNGDRCLNPLEITGMRQ